MEKEYLYILYAVSARHMKPEAIDKAFEVFKISHPHPKKVTRELYENLMKNLYKESIDISVDREVIAYFLDEEEALKCAKGNIADYNDGGCYNFGMIEKLPLHASYPSFLGDCEYWLFKYVHNDNFGHYEPIDFKENDLTKAIMKKYNSMFNEN